MFSNNSYKVMYVLEMHLFELLKFNVTISGTGGKK